PRDPLSGGGLRLGLRLRRAGGAVDAVSRGFLARIARAPPEPRAEGAGQTTDRVARRVVGGGTRPVRRRAAAFGRPHLAARALAAEINAIPGRIGERGPYDGPGVW